MNTNSLVARSLLVLCMAFMPSIAFAQSQTPPPVAGQTAVNHPPKLTSYSWLSTKVDPLRGNSGDTFKFGVDYNDEDGEKCTVCQVWIDLNHNGEFDDDEKFDMKLVDAKQNEIAKENWDQLDWKSYQHFFFVRQIRNLSTDTDVAYRFVFSDGKDVAVELGAYTETGTVTIFPELVVDQSSAELSAVPGGGVKVVVDVFVNKKFSKDFEFRWDNFDESKLPTGFKLRERTLETGDAEGGLTKKFERVRISMYFDVAPTTPIGVSTLLLPKLGYQVKSTKEEREVDLPKIVIDVVDRAITVPQTTAPAGTLGSPFTYEFSILLGAGSADAGDIVEALNHQSMLPFTVVSRTITRASYALGATIINARFQLALDGSPPGQYQIPAISLGTIGLKPISYLLLPIDPPGKTPSTKAEKSQLLKKLLTAARPLNPSFSVATGMITNSLFATAGTLLAIVMVVVIVSIVRFTRRNSVTRKDKQHRRACRDAYERAIRTYREQHDFSSLSASYHALRAYLASLAGVQIPSGITARAVRNMLPISAPAELLDTLEELENSYYKS